MATVRYLPIEYLEHERATWFFVGISGSDLSNGKDGIGRRRSNSKKRVLAEKLKELEKRKKRRKKGKEGGKGRVKKRKKKMGCESQSGRFIPNARTLRVYIYIYIYMRVCMLERYQVSNEPNVRKTNGLPRSRA